MKLKEKNRRVCYWVAIGLILTMFGAFYSHYVHMEDLLEYTQRKSSRQMHITVDNWYQQILLKNEKIKLLERQMIQMEEHHAKELGDCVEFYTTALEEVRHK